MTLPKWIQRVLHTAPQRFSGTVPPAGDCVVRISGEARAVVQEESLAVFHSGRGMMFKANGAGAQIWQALAGGASIPALAKQLACRYGIPEKRAESDVLDFVAQLRAAGLLTCAGV